MSNGNDGKGDITTVEPEVSDEELEVAFKQIGNLKVGFDSMTQGQKLGVLQRLVTAVVKDEQYRQILLTAAFESKEEAMLASDAIAERKRYGVPIHPIVDRMLAQCSINADRVNKVLEAMSHFTLNTNYPGKKPWFQRKEDTKSLVG